MSVYVDFFVFFYLNNLLYFPSQVKGNANLQASLENQKKALHEYRLALQQDVCSMEKIYYSFYCYFDSSLFPLFLPFQDDSAGGGHSSLFQDSLSI